MLRFKKVRPGIMYEDMRTLSRMVQRRLLSSCCRCLTSGARKHDGGEWSHQRSRWEEVVCASGLHAKGVCLGHLPALRSATFHMSLALMRLFCDGYWGLAAEARVPTQVPNSKTTAMPQRLI